MTVGICVACEQLRIPCVVIKGVSHHGEDKNEGEIDIIKKRLGSYFDDFAFKRNIEKLAVDLEASEMNSLEKHKWVQKALLQRKGS